MKRIILFLPLVCMLLVSCEALTNKIGESPERDLFSEVKSVNKLVLAQMTVSKMASIDDISMGDAQGLKQKTSALLNSVKVGNRKAAYSYDTYLRAYIDLANLSPDDVEVDEISKRIVLTLPEVSTEFMGRDLGIREEHYRVTGMRSEIDAKERAAIKEKMNKALKQEVEEKPFFKDKLIGEAKAKAQTYFSSMLGKDGYVVTVNFKEK